MSPVVLEGFEAAAAALGRSAGDLAGQTIAICGGAGFIGSHFVGTIEFLNREILRRPCRILILDNYITGSEKNLLGVGRSREVSRFKVDVRKPFKFPRRVDFLVHAAGLASPFYYRKFPLETIGSAVFGTQNLLEMARRQGVGSFLFFSSSEIYGDPDPNFVPTPESYKGNVSSTGPRACYDESKRLGETLCVTYHALYRSPVKIVRPFNVYGPGMKSDDYRVVPMFVVRALSGDFLPVHDGGSQTRTFCYTSDAMAGFLKVLLSGRAGEIYNVGRDAEEINILRLAQLVAEIVGPRTKVRVTGYPDAYPADEPRRRCPDLHKIRRELGYRPRVRLEEGLRKTVSWYRGLLGVR